MKLRPGASTPVSRWLALGLCLLVAAVVVAPLGLGFSHGICVGCEVYLFLARRRGVELVA